MNDYGELIKALQIKAPINPHEGLLMMAASALEALTAENERVNKLADNYSQTILWLEEENAELRAALHNQHEDYTEFSDFCPNCGAKMKADTE